MMFRRATQFSIVWLCFAFTGCSGENSTHADCGETDSDSDGAGDGDTDTDTE